MEETIYKIWFQVGKSICLILLFSVLITSCNGQHKTDIPKDSMVESTIIPIDTAVKGSLPFMHTNTDPLFFIEGQLCQHLRKIFQDKSGHLWFGTNVYGLMRYDGNTLEYFNKNNGYDYSRITGFAEDKEGNMWFSSYQGLTKYNPSTKLKTGSGSFTNFTEKDGLLENEIWSLLIDRNGIFWIGTTEGVSRFDGKEFTTFPIPKAKVRDTTTVFSYDRITSIMEDRNGTLWFGTDGFGICKYDPSASPGPGGKTFTLITMEDGLPDNNVADIMEDKAGNIWIGTMFGGVSRYDGKSYTNYTQDGVISGVEVGGFYEDKTGNIWFAAENYGVYRYDGKSFINFYTNEGIATNGILSIFEDKEGRFWFGGWGGLFRYDGNSFLPVTKEGPWVK